MAFISSFCTYLLIMIILIAVALCGAKVGIMLRKNKNAKEASAATESSEQ